MPKDVLKLSCPCCGKRIEVDVRTGKARAAKAEEATASPDLDKLLDQQKRDSERLASTFDRAAKDQISERERLARLFESAKEDARDDDSKPPNPFDLE